MVAKPDVDRSSGDKIEVFEMFPSYRKIGWKDKITNQDFLQRLGT